MGRGVVGDCDPSGVAGSGVTGLAGLPCSKATLESVSVKSPRLISCSVRSTSPSKSVVICRVLRDDATKCYVPA